MAREPVIVSHDTMYFQFPRNGVYVGSKSPNYLSPRPNGVAAVVPNHAGPHGLLEALKLTQRGLHRSPSEAVDDLIDKEISARVRSSASKAVYPTITREASKNTLHVIFFPESLYGLSREPGIKGSLVIANQPPGMNSDNPVLIVYNNGSPVIATFGYNGPVLTHESDRKTLDRLSAMVLHRHLGPMMEVDMPYLVPVEPFSDTVEPVPLRLEQAVDIPEMRIGRWAWWLKGSWNEYKSALGINRLDQKSN